MIPTRYKAKLSGRLSYPVGAMEISDALAGAAHRESLSLCFHTHAVQPASHFQRVLTDRLPYTVLRAEHEPARKPGLSAAGFMIERGWYDEHWELTVFPVLRAFRHAANRLLREEGLPALSSWLGRAEELARGMIPQRLELVFNPAEESLAVVEGGRHNESRV